MRPKTSTRPALAGPASPQPPFPIPVSGPIVKGFGRGSAELGIPTANVPLTGLSVGGHEGLESGVYFGWCGVDVDRGGDKATAPGTDSSAGSADEGKSQGGDIMIVDAPGGTVFPMVMSLGYNPYYKNTVRSIEVHILHQFARDFYGRRMNLLICGFVRPEYDYEGVDALVEDIRFDVEVARKSLGREGYVKIRDEADSAVFLRDFSRGGWEDGLGEDSAQGNGGAGAEVNGVAR